MLIPFSYEIQLLIYFSIGPSVNIDGPLGALLDL